MLDLEDLSVAPFSDPIDNFVEVGEDPSVLTNKRVVIDADVDVTWSTVSTFGPLRSSLTMSGHQIVQSIDFLIFVVFVFLLAQQQTDKPLTQVKRQHRLRIFFFRFVVDIRTFHGFSPHQLTLAVAHIGYCRDDVDFVSFLALHSLRHNCLQLLQVSLRRPVRLSLLFRQFMKELSPGLFFLVEVVPFALFTPCTEFAASVLLRRVLL